MVVKLRKLCVDNLSWKLNLKVSVGLWESNCVFLINVLYWVVDRCLLGDFSVVSLIFVLVNNFVGGILFLISIFINNVV